MSKQVDTRSGLEQLADGAANYVIKLVAGAVLITVAVCAAIGGLIYACMR